MHLVWARRAIAVALACGLLADFSTPAAARGRHGGRRHDDAERRLAPAAPEREPKGALFAVVSLADQRVSFYDADGLWAQGKVSTGVSSHPTPTGLFVILEKERWHRSNLYAGAPMPFMQRLAWTGVAMHEGYVTGRPASHGCVRLKRDFAKRLFGVTKVGQRVIISPYDVAPAAVSHPHLPSPALQPAPGGVASAPAANVVAANTPETASDASAAQPAANLLDPLQYARALHASAESKAAAAAHAGKAASLRLKDAMRSEQALIRNMRIAGKALEVTKADLAVAVRREERAHGEAAKKKAAERKAALEARLAEMQKRVEEAQNAKVKGDEEVAAATKAARETREQAVSAASAQKEATRRLEPVSMLISRKTGKLQVRQGFQTLLETPISIRDPERPLGTHMFIAAQAENGPALRWSGVTVPAVTAWGEERRARRRSRDRDREAPAPVSMAGDTAAGALDRVEIPKEAQERISPLLWTGATLIISDLGPSGEGRFPMDFQILTHARGRGR